MECRATMQTMSRGVPAKKYSCRWDLNAHLLHGRAQVLQLRLRAGALTVRHATLLPKALHILRASHTVCAESPGHGTLLRGL